MGGGIVVEGLTKTYGRARTTALDNVSLEIDEGEIFGLIGPNGAGKTTFFGCLLGLLRASGGSIRIDGKDPDAIAVRRASGYLPERLQFDRWMTGRRFLAYHHCLAGLPRARREADVAGGLGRVALEPGRWDTPIKKYSRGMLQRLGMAQALIGDPKFVFLDEPASGVDPAGVLAFREILTDLKRRGATVILNSHQLDQLERICDRVAYIEAGRIRNVENLRQPAEGRRLLVVRWLVGQATPPSERLVAVATQTGAEIGESGVGQARVSVADDAQAAALLRALVEAGFAIVEAAPEGGRLEKFFRPGAGVA